MGGQEAYFFLGSIGLGGSVRSRRESSGLSGSYQTRAPVEKGSALI